MLLFLVVPLNGGVGTYAKFYQPYGISISPNGNFALVADAGNNMIRSVDISTLAVTRFAGTVTSGSTNGIGTNSLFNYPVSVSISPDNLYALIVETVKVRKVIISTAQVTDFVGGGSGTATNGIGTVASFYSPKAIKISPNGIFALVTDTTTIRRIDLSGASVTTLASGFTLANGISISPDNLFALVTDISTQKVSKIILSTASVIFLAGKFSSFTNGIGTNANFNSPYGVSILPNGLSAIISDTRNNALRQIIISTTAVSTLTSGITGILGVDLSSDGVYALSSNNGHIIQQIIISTTSVNTFVGFGLASGYLDGLGTNVKYKSLVSISMSNDYALLVDGPNQAIRKLIVSTKSVTTFAGGTGGATDGFGTNAQFMYPNSISLSSDSSFALVSDSSNGLLRYLEMSTSAVTRWQGMLLCMIA
jgi:DNA-binding beta-propeller fold protein YncE